MTKTSVAFVKRPDKRLLRGHCSCPEGKFPSVLHHLPPSATKVFLVLALSSSNGAVTIPLQLLARRAGISKRQAARALRRLEGAKLIERTAPPKGRKPACYRVLLTFPQARVAPSPAPSSQRRRERASKKTAPALRRAAVLDLPIRRPSKALAWAMSQIRREIQRWDLPPPRRETLIRGLGAALWRAIRRGLVRTTAALRRLVTGIILRLRQDAPEGVSANLRWACGFAGWAVLSALREFGILAPRGKTRPCEDPAATLRQKLHELRLRYRMPWLTPAERARIELEGCRLKKMLEQMGG